MAPIPATGPVSFLDLQAEFNDTSSARMDEFYRNGGLVPNAPANSSIPTSGTISLADFRGAINELVVTISDAVRTNLNLQVEFDNTFGSGTWTSNVPKRLIISSNTTIGSASLTPALSAPSGGGGSITLENRGSIQGSGGAGGVFSRSVSSSRNGIPGGPAARIQSAISLENIGSIRGGGGGGAAGGGGSPGGCSQTTFPCGGGPGGCGNCGCGGGSSECGRSCVNNCGFRRSQCFFVCRCKRNPQPNGSSAGGNGGNGGRGQGYNRSRTVGTNGSLSPDCPGPSGRTGGYGGNGTSGGTFGNPGATPVNPCTNGPTSGRIPAGSVGSAGNSISGVSNVTFVGPTGSIAGPQSG